MDSGNQNTPESTAREKKGGFWDTLMYTQIQNVIFYRKKQF